MLIDVFIVLLVFSVFLVWLGLYSKNSVLQAVGYGFIFLLGWVLLPASSDSLLVRNGSVSVTNVQNESVESYTYYSFENHLYGFYMSLIGVLGWLSVYLDYKARREDVF